MFWAVLTRPLQAFITIAPGWRCCPPVLLPLTAALVKPLIKPVTNLYLDIAGAMGRSWRSGETESMSGAKEKRP